MDFSGNEFVYILQRNHPAKKLNEFNSNEISSTGMLINSKPESPS